MIDIVDTLLKISVYVRLVLGIPLAAGLLIVWWLISKMSDEPLIQTLGWFIRAVGIYLIATSVVYALTFQTFTLFGLPSGLFHAANDMLWLYPAIVLFLYQLVRETKKRKGEEVESADVAAS